MRLGRRQALGIAGMVLAVAGAVAWYYGLQIPAIAAWIAAFLLALKLNKKKNQPKKT